ncbi:MAG: LytR C-terminal domain-containing protein [Solirubrobacteraceae bacterium]|nr:LytR C-terminal domain-containing protein [Solirubrobacteraceae bacterium]
MVIADLVDTLSRIGAIGGILSIIGVGLLILLVASQNREIRSMREWIEEEPQRQQETAQRVIAEVQRRIAAARDRRAAATGAPAGAAGVPRPLPAAPGTLGATPEAQKIAASKEIVPPGPGTPEIPVPGVPAPDGAPKFAPLTPAGGAEGDASVPPPAPAEEEPAVVSGFLNQETQAADALPEPDPVPAAAGNPADVRFNEELYDLEEEESGGGSRVLFGVGVVALLAGIVIAGFVLFGGGGDEPVTSNTPEQTDGEGGEGGGSSDTTETTPRETTVNPSSINVRVLNGTTVSGLAQRVTDRLKGDGFGTDRPDTLTSNQTVQNTTVSYREGQRASAIAVAEALGLTESAVQPLDADLSVAAGETAEVVVLTGTDLDNSASGTTAE